MRSKSSLVALATALSTLLTVGCSSTHEVMRPSSLDSFAAVTRYTGARVDVILAPQADDPVDPHSVEALRSRSARLLGVADDGVSVMRKGEEKTLALGDIRGYDVTRHGRGALEGLGFGALAGATFGVFAGLVAGSDPPCTNEDFCLRFTAGDKALFGGLAGVVTGALSGLLLGALIGHTDHYVF
jgi:hypothetical protein